ncbi:MULTISPECIES: histidinol-phosphate transaminase [Auritidibacter]|uniref:Histidinol-phosphate aminotransferase n=1 Tax=Auritidibacter ignavus TaxID=678932 RepID=A0AAJ6ANJ0_9MICC|nr:MULTISPECIES: histidinol-phosphate transaminase [Auritidibacter]NIH72316.1 histidinol-phosphate aminotransferase [Auritidibacter ignavus]WGH82436.1 histidinol-phosphate transaminase [Auritidibacter ignavus]WGH84690.1 histidinol-phosphate transaminase [Auritidibacter ignavus]WGH87001.1 histidinol-phosphate transaminase [Auritidibacter ignavus]WGH89284.1 histidinol-phosphate transaminase [Auritidibacter ignavus]
MDSQKSFDPTALQRLPLRDALRGQSPYGAPQIEVPYALNTNENTHPVPPAVVDAIGKATLQAATTLNRYPDREFTELREQLAQYLGHGLSREHLWAANGSNEILQQILQAFGGPGRSVLSFPPTYSMYPLLALGTETAYVSGVRAEDFTLSPESAAQQVRETRPNLVLLCSPNNPTGTALGLDVVKAVYEVASEINALVVVDEAYAEFALEGTASALSLLPSRPLLIVTRTMSKAFALAGARLGYLAAAPEITDALRLVRLPYHLSATTQATALAALAHREALLENVEAIRTQRDRIVADLTEMGLKPHTSDSNFVFFGWLEDARAVWQSLLDRGVLVRDVGIAHHLRVTAGTEEETSAFLKALRDIVTHTDELPL